MAADRDAGVDPRFDPLFQRGYDPGRHGARRVRDAAPAAGVRAGEWASTAVHADPEAAGRGVPEAELAERVVPETDGFQPEVEEQERINPYRLALLLASIGAIGGAAIMLWRKIDDQVGTFPSAYDVGELFADQFTDALLVPLLTGGLIGLGLWLVLGALGPRRD